MVNALLLGGVSGSPPPLPPTVKVLSVDLTSLDSLTKAFVGIDVIISTVAGKALPHEPLFIAAAIAAGVKRFIPSGYGVSPSHPYIHAQRDHPFFSAKVSTFELLKSLEDEGKLTHTTIVTSAFADWGFEYSFWGIDIPNRKAILIDGGDVPYTSTNLVTVGRTLAWVVTNLEASKNREIFIQDVEATQNEWLAETENQIGGAPFEKDHYTSEEAFKKGVELAGKGEAAGIMLVLLSVVCGRNGAGRNERDDSKEVGYETKGLKEIVRDAIKFWDEKKLG